MAPLARNNVVVQMPVLSRHRPGSNSSSESVWLRATRAMVSTTRPTGWLGIKLVKEMKNTLARAVKALRAWACRPESARPPNTRSGAIETDTKSRPRSAALACVLATRKFAYATGIMASSWNQPCCSALRPGEDEAVSVRVAEGCERAPDLLPGLVREVHAHFEQV